MAFRSTTAKSAWSQSWRKDLLSSIVVFLVALPLCMGIALASGAPVDTGIVTGIVGGLVVGMLAGAPLQVSGPAVGLAVICADVIRQYGMPAFGVVVLIAGIAQLLAGVFRFGQWFRAVSPAVIHGMLSGIGVVIVLSQLHVMVDDRPRENSVANLLSIPEALSKGLPLPTWEETPVRKSRTELLQAFLNVHERQGEIERAVDRTITKHGSEELHRLEIYELGAFIPQQQSVIEEFRQAVAAYQQSPLADHDDEKSTRFRAALVTAEAALQDALNDLTDDPLELAEDAEIAAGAALADVVAQLKSHNWAAKIGLLSIVIIILWQTMIHGRMRIVPAPLVAVMAATLLAFVFSLPVLYVEVPENLVDGLTFPTWTVFEDVSFQELLVAGLMMAVIASAETLLCATAVDQMHTGPRTRYNRELAAQGIGNMICGFLGALPMTGVIVRSAANVHAGARSRLSTILHGLWLLVMVLAFAPLLRIIPTAALAGILVFTGFKLIDFKGFLRLWREHRSEAVIFLATLLMIVVEDLLVGVVTGVILSAIKLLLRFSRLDLDLVKSVSGGRVRTTLVASGAATFLRLPMLAAKLEQVPAGSDLFIDVREVDYIDHACMELIRNWARQHKATGGSITIDWKALDARFRAAEGREPSGNGALEEPAHSDSAA